MTTPKCSSILGIEAETPIIHMREHRPPIALAAKKKAPTIIPNPPIKYTESSFIFLANVSVYQIQPTQRTFTTSTTLPLSVNLLSTCALGIS